ncbi:hypothetical protein TMatcc_001886 [Talaromyces marneffei ATCC 18224]|uniref:Anaphase-promoting complex, subunit 15/MND2 n=2 Tax=Talaromyces marneffei TaxID=37727 RepID=B6QI24_TALMQ|nr:uncharacterized protein EYB26_006924 [Talaromyces marneffei]EEA23019.1 conserved hypothetical protein [Talaromyces marneffei ATCC 18224]KAE8551890.1 hypothetical protein EYB25_005781 [Talaromyces marneffei]QGA19236.1 hypothetical protein EYB26_006924 [Talaromyces marneffei]
MLSVPLVAPRDSHELWFGSSRPRYRGSTNASSSEPSATRRQQLHNGNGNLLTNAPTSTRAVFSSTTPSNSLAMLQLEERALRLRKENIASFGAAWIKPAGIPKTMQGMREEEAEREEGLAAAQQELNVAAMVAAAGAGGAGVMDMDAFGGEAMLQQQQQDMMMGGDNAGVAGEGDGNEADELERDLDDDIPEAEDNGFEDSGDEEGLVEEGEEAYEEELMDRNLDDDIPDGYPDEDDDDDDDDDDDEEDAYDDDEMPGGDEIPVRDLDDDIPEANDLEDEDMDDDIPEAEEWQHTDSELEDNDDSDLDGDHTGTHDPFAHYGGGDDGIVSTNTQTPASANTARRGSRRSSTHLPPPPQARTRETEAQRRFLQRWSGVGVETDSDNETLPSPMMGVDNDEEDDDLRASITSAGYARGQVARSARMRQAQSRFGRFMRRGGPRDSLD